MRRRSRRLVMGRRFTTSARSESQRRCSVSPAVSLHWSGPRSSAIDSFDDPFAGRTVQLDGPWDFRVEL